MCSKTKHLSMFLPSAVAVSMLLLSLSCETPKPDLAKTAENLKNVLMLQTAEFEYHDVIYQGKQDKVLGLITTGDTKLLFSLNFRVQAGVDVQKGIELQPIDNLPSDQQPGVLVKLYPAEILKIDADEKSIREYFSYEMPFLEHYYGIGTDRKINWLDVQDEIGKAKDRIKTDAAARGIEDKAWKNAVTLVSNFLGLSGFKTVRVEQTATESDAPVDSKK